MMCARVGPLGRAVWPARQRIQALWHRQHLCGCEPKAGRHFTNVTTPNRSGAEFAQVVQRLVVTYPSAVPSIW